MQQVTSVNNKSWYSQQSTYVSWFILSLIILPFFVISYFHHPLGDDYWITAMVREHGYIRAQEMLHKTVTARYSLLAITGLSPLTFGNFWLYKLIPIVFISFYWYTLAYFLRSIVHKEARKTDTYLLSAVIIATYIVVMPGLGEGIYWMSSLVSYQVGILLFLWWLALWIRFRRKENNSRWYGVAACIVLSVLLGLNELFSMLATGIIVLSVIYRMVMRKKPGLELIMFAIAGIAWSVLLGALSFEHRYLSVAEKGNVSVLHAISYAIAQVGYHIGKCLLNPFFWIGVVLGATPLIRLTPHLIFDLKIVRKHFIFFLVLWGGSMVFISFLTYYFNKEHLVPLRITNIFLFIFFFGFAFGGMLLYHYWGKNTNNRIILSIAKYRYVVVAGLFLAALFLRNNFTTSWSELASGKMGRYEQQMKQRYSLLEQCKSDTCYIPVLKDMPSTIRFSITDDEPHLEKYFRKVIVFQ